MKNAILGGVVGAVVVGAVWFFAGQPATVAAVGSDKITTKDFYAKLEQGSASKDTLKQMIDSLVIDHQAKANNITVTDKEIDDEYNNFLKERFNNDKSQLDAALKQYNMTNDELRAQMKTSLLSEKIATKDITISDKDIQDYYDKNKETLGTPEQITARHILIKDEKKAQEIYDKVKANPNDFATLAKANSEDPGSKDKGGELDPFGKGAMVPEFEKAAFAAKVGDIVGPVKSEFGYHIIQVEKHQDAVIPKLADVKDKITKTLKQQKAKPLTDLMNELYAKEKIDIKNTTYKDILQPAAPDPAAAGGATGGAATTDGAATAPATSGDAAATGGTTAPTTPATPATGK